MKHERGAGALTTWQREKHPRQQWWDCFVTCPAGTGACPLYPQSVIFGFQRRAFGVDVSVSINFKVSFKSESVAAPNLCLSSKIYVSFWCNIQALLTARFEYHHRVWENLGNLAETHLVKRELKCSFHGWKTESKDIKQGIYGWRIACCWLYFLIHEVKKPKHGCENQSKWSNWDRRSTQFDWKQSI